MESQQFYQPEVWNDERKPRTTSGPHEGKTFATGPVKQSHEFENSMRQLTLTADGEGILHNSHVDRVCVSFTAYIRRLLHIEK